MGRSLVSASFPARACALSCSVGGLWLQRLALACWPAGGLKAAVCQLAHAPPPMRFCRHDTFTGNPDLDPDGGKGLLIDAGV